MINRLVPAASALALAGALAAPAAAQGPAAMTAASAPVVLTEQAASSLAAAAATPIIVTAADEALSGTANAAASEATPIVLTAASGAAPGLAEGAEIAMTSAAITAAAAAAAQASGPADREDRFTVVLNQDAFFGFYPTFNGLIQVGDNVDFSFYGILWTTPDFSSATGLGSDLWTEFGVGANFILADGALQVKPQVGITNGALLSRGNLGNGPGGTTTTLNGGNVFDGIVPSLTVNYSDDAFEAEFYGGYYAALRNRSDDVGALDFLHTWFNAGYKFADKFSAGAHIEFLANTRVDLPGGSASNVYEWYGPYVQFSTGTGFFARFTGGIEEGGGAGGNRGDFYKVAVGMSF